MKHDRSSRGIGPTAMLHLLFVVLVAWSAGARADAYLVISMIGDRLTVVTQGPQTGTHLDGNRYDVLSLAGPDFDVADAASGAIEMRQNLAVGTTHSETKSPDGSVWNSVPMSDKIPALQSLVIGEVDRRLASMLSSSSL